MAFRYVLFFPAWDRTDPDPKKNYGVSDVNIKFIVMSANKDKCVECDLSTNWYLPHVMDRRLEYLKKDVLMGEKDFLLKTWISPKLLDICYNSLTQVSEDDTYFDTGLSYVFDGRPCWYGYKYVKEENGMWTTDYVYDDFLRRGDEAIWEYLGKYYVEVFGEDK